jgi:cellulose synthase operon protein C
MAIREPDLALQLFEKAPALEPSNSAIKVQVGALEIDAGRSEQGLATLEQLFGTEAGAPLAGPTLVIRELQARRLDKAAEAANSLVKMDDKNPISQSLLGIVRVAQQDFPGAESAFREALAIKSDFTTASLELARLYAATKRVDKARGLFNDLLAMNPKELGALLGLADTYIAQQQWSEAINTIKKARAAAPDDPAPGLKLVSVYEERQDWTSAKSLAAELAVQFARNPDILDTEGRARLAAGYASGAASSFKRAYELVPNSVPILSHYIAALRAANFFADARAGLQEALIRDPQNSSVKADLIRIEAEINGVDAAVVEARALAEGGPQEQHL